MEPAVAVAGARNDMVIKWWITVGGHALASSILDRREMDSMAQHWALARLGRASDFSTVFNMH